MEIKSIQKYQDFLNKIHLIDQTFLIDTILKQDKHLDYFNSIVNRVEYKLLLSDGEFTGTDDLLELKRRKVTDQINEIAIDLQEHLLEKDHRKLLQQKSCLEDDLVKIEEANGKDKQIFHWYLIPYWFSCSLLEMGEVVFRHFGCSWWGVSSLLQEYWSKDQLLLDVMGEVSIGENL